MKILMILLSVMTWTVESKNAVKLSDTSEVPYDIEVTYANTYNKGQVRSGDVATLTLSHLDGITIEEVALSMRSNNGSGAGTIDVTADTHNLAHTTVTWQQVSEEVVVFSGAQAGVQSLTISLSGTQNSLYVDAFRITWSSAAARTVTLMHGSTVMTTLTEASGGDGIQLPSLENEENWRFVGWSETEFWTIYEKPEYYPTGARYYPNGDCVLWATYQYAEMTGEKPFVTELFSGSFMYVNRETKMALTGVPTEGRMNAIGENIYDDNQHYRIEFAGTDTAYIEHIPTGQPIGYNGTEMAAKSSPWLVYHEGDQTLFYTIVNGKNYVLWLNIYDPIKQTIYAGLLQTDPGASPMGLKDTFMPTEIYAFTCHPEAKVGIELTSEGMNELVSERKIVFGIYEIYIRNGKKYLILR